ncbi:MAG: GNAT family N-acetyltransferase [Micrococcales bacterium]|nr:GNAT family N-acetyltransferase [Micrococcales bacterium]
MSEPVIRPAVPSDLEALVRINDAAAPAVPITPLEELRALVELSELALVVDDGTPAGFLLAMTPGRDYASENYLWFSRRSAAFVYVDRIVLDPRLRGAGLGRGLYERVFARGRELGAVEVTCEVNLQPPNPASLAFHRRMGFTEVGRQWTKGASTEVALLAAPLDLGRG